MWITACSSTLIGDGSVTTSPDSETGFSTDDATDDVGDDIDVLREFDVDRPAEVMAVDIDRVVDGDSVWVIGPEGELEVRLIGINAPERGGCFAEDARQMLSTIVADARDVALSPWPPEYDDFGRVLGFVWTPDGLANLELVTRGAVVARAQSDHPFADSFEAAETHASERGLGLWAPDACGAIAGNVRIVQLEADAPGNDRENPNGEWVLIENAGQDAVNLLGWTIRDESTRHRHTFGNLTLRPGQQLRLRTGCGDDDLDADPIEAFWCDPEPPVWNNDGDTAFLLDPNGSTADHYR